jgi:antitoxin HigA-1
MKSLRDPKRRPTHPGAVLREDILPALGLTQGQFAEHMGVSRLTVSELVHEKRGLSAEIAVRLAMVLRTTPETWMRMQQAVDLWEAQQDAGKFEKVQPLPKELLAA